MMTFWAFVAGVVSFLSPCVLSLAPVYLGVISGCSVAELSRGSGSRARVVRSTLAFVAGFALVFILLGATSSFLGGLLRVHRTSLAKLGGVVVILFGLHQGGWLKIAPLYQERRLLPDGRGGSAGGAWLTGMAFAFGWTPCVGPILGSILALAGSQGELLQGVWLLAVYAAGLALPFLLLAVGFERVLPRLQSIRRYHQYLAWFSGVCLVLMGVLLVTGGLNDVSAWFMRLTGGWSPEGWLRAPHADRR